MGRLTLVRVHLEVEVGEEQLAEVEQPNIDVSAAADTHERPNSHPRRRALHRITQARKRTTHLLMILSISSASSGFPLS